MATKSEWVTTLMSEHPYGSLHSMVDGVRTPHSNAEHDVIIDNWADGRVADEARKEILKNGGASAEYAHFRTEQMIDGSYPTIGDQLDMLYRDITNGKFGEDAKTSTWYAAVKATKDKFTKPS